MKRTLRITKTAVALGVLMLGWCGVAFSAGAKEKLPVPDFTQGGKTDGSHDWTLGPTGARGWIYSTKGQTAEARQILITAVAKGSPSDGTLSIGDVILGVGDQRFSGDARIQFANAIAAAEQEKAAVC